MQSVGYYCGYTMHLYCRFYFFDTLVEVGSYEVHYHYRILYQLITLWMGVNTV
jgi:hypothetical protein